jgi:release factor glutamine methyltransferase
MTTGTSPATTAATASATTIGSLLDALASTMVSPGVPPDRGGARDLIAALLDKQRFWPSGHREVALDDEIVARARAAAAGIREGMPFAYAVGTAAFRHLTLRVDRRVLIPRPETEMLVDMALGVTGGRGAIADVCTGSGAIALALAAEGQFDRVIGTDLSRHALSLAKENIGVLSPEKASTVEFREGDLCAPLAGERLAAIVANPPYIANPERSGLPPSVRDWEPSLALFSGDDGMDAIRGLVAGAADIIAPGGSLLVEIDARRGVAARLCAESDGRWSDVEIRPDLAGRDRFLVARRASR